MAVQGFNLDVRADMARLTQNIAYFEQHEIPFVTAYALTKTAQDIRTEEYRVMEQVFDRPTRFTLNSLMVKTANKKNLQASVEFKEGFNSIPAWKYLGPQVEGGPRRHKSFESHLIRNGIMLPHEFAVPGAGAKRDAHGNIPGHEIVRILSQLGAAENAAGYTMNMSGRSRKRAVRRAGGQYEVIRGSNRLKDGIYLRRNLRSLTPVLIFVGQPQYQKRYPFKVTAEQTYQRSFPRHFRAGWRNFVRRPSMRDVPF
jgi:hypothetical protein